MRYHFKKKRYIFLARLLDLVGSPAKRLRRGRLPRDFKKILIVRLDHLGDVVLSTAMPKAVKEAFPESRLVFLTSSGGASLLQGNPFVDNILVYDAPWFSRGGAGRGSYLKTVAALRAEHFDVGIAPRGDLRENALMALAGVRERIGYGVTGGGFLLTREGRYPETAHEIESSRQLLKMLGAEFPSFNPAVYLSDAERGGFAAKLAEWGMDKDKRYVGFQPEAGYPSKNWPAGHVRDFVDGFVREFGDRELVVVGERGRGTVELPGGVRALDLRGRTTLRELCYLMEFFDFFVGPDSGPAHLASARGVPTLFLYSGTNTFERWRPLEDSAFVLRREVPCSPCHLNICNVPGHPCMTGILPEDALNVLRLHLKNAAR